MPNHPDPLADGESLSQTGFHARRAVAGDPPSLDWIASRFSPLLEARAKDQLARGLRHVCDPADVVNTVWERALPKLRTLEPGDDGYARSILRFLTKIQTDLVTDLLRRELRSRHLAPIVSANESSPPDPILRVADDSTSLFSRVTRNETYAGVVRELGQLQDDDR
jgi:hypothetical protein